MTTGLKNFPRMPALVTRARFTGALVPAALGAGVALLLGGVGFGAGSLYARVFLPVAGQAAAAVAGPAATGPLGGPDESAPPVLPSGPKIPASASRSGKSPAAGFAMARPVVGGWVSSGYGQRADPFTGDPAVHRGLDFAGLDNSSILAVAPGVVVRSGAAPGYGNLIEIDHGRGWITRYGHNAFNLVAPGDYVKPGQTIALMGATGRATGTHLHFEVLYRGRHQNPARFVPRST